VLLWGGYRRIIGSIGNALYALQITRRREAPCAPSRQGQAAGQR
jgi:hypothetical protein